MPALHATGSLETTWLIEGRSSESAMVKQWQGFRLTAVEVEGLLSLGEIVESLLKALRGLRRPGERRDAMASIGPETIFQIKLIL
jgi:hypothetical protein